MSIKRYNEKRKFDETPEPKGAIEKRKGELRFVVQKHHASHLHFDFRLELDGTLKSWAVPKQPSMNPKIKRLAMMVEDHPISYMKFEGIIPEGNYGAGHVMVWDIGTYHSMETDDPKESEKILKKQLENGDMKITLNGEKLKGNFALVKTKGYQKNSWLLIKKQDEYAKDNDPEYDYSVLSKRTLEEIKEGKEKKDDADLTKAFESELPKEVRPMLATLVKEPFDNNDWLYEIKLDGYRALAEISAKVRSASGGDGKVRLYTRNNITINKDYEKVVKDLEKVNYNLLLDGEIVVLNKEGIPDFELLQQYKKTGKGNIKYYVFDILYYDKFNFTKLPLTERKKLLKQVLPEGGTIKFHDHIIEKGKALLSEMKKKGIEGILAKKMDSEYQLNKRSDDWLKIKIINSQEVIICGYTEPKGGRKLIGSLVTGMYKNGKLIYTGNVGTGLNEQHIEDLKKKLEPLEQEKPIFDKVSRISGKVHWVKPKIVCEVEFTEWTSEGSMRHPSFKALREDKKSTEAKEEKPEVTPLNAKEDLGKADVTNSQKIFWPKERYTKGHVISYYNDVAELMLPYLKDRPQSLRRNPHGIKDDGFFQKDIDFNIPDWVETVKIYSESNEDEINYMMCQNKDTLIYMANLGCIEINPWSSRIQNLSNPDYAIFDLDPLEIRFEKVVEVANEIRDIFEKIEVEGFCKTSGGKGLHIYVPLGAKYTYEQSQNFVKLVELLVHSKLPNTTSLERMPAKRKKKVYLDFLQNAEGKTMVSPYCIRPKDGAPVSTPLKWKEVNKKLNPKDYNLGNARKRFDKVGDLWEGILGKGIDMKKTLEKLKELL